MTTSRRDEARQDRHNAAFKEKCRKVRQRNPHLPMPSSSLETVEVSGSSSGAKHDSGKNTLTRIPLKRPPVLKPVVSSAWSSVPTGDASSTPAQNLESTTDASDLASSSVNTIAIAEQGHEDFGLQTFESIGSDVVSMEEVLPTDFHGVPLTSVKEQKISQDLLRLSKVLQVKDFNSTGGSTASEFPSSECSEGLQNIEKIREGETSALDNVSASFFHESQDTVVEVVNENMASGFMDNSTDELSVNVSSSPPHCSANTNASGTSSANTSATTDSHKSSSRCSPRSIKSNTVHFASFVTEYIDTSASLSSENFTIVKKKLSAEQAAKNAVNIQNNRGVETDECLLGHSPSGDQHSPKAVNSLSSPTSTPFSSNMKSEHSVSDKENDSKQANKLSSSSILRHNQPLSSYNSSKVTDSQGSCMSDAAAANVSESSSSTVVEDAAVSAQDSVNCLPLNITEDSKSDLQPHKKSDTAALRKPKRLPPEPHQSKQQNDPDSEVKAQNSEGENATEGEVRKTKGHVRRNSYTLSTPSPALLRSQASSEMNRELLGEESIKREKSKKLNSNASPTVPSEPETTGKAEHINKYLSQVQFHSFDDAASSQQFAAPDQDNNEESSQYQTSFGILQSLNHSQNSLSSLGSGDILQEFHLLKQNLVEQQQKELEELFIQQRREQMHLQEEIEEHQRRMKEQQDFLVCNAPENLKVKSQVYDGELSPSSNTGEETGVKRFRFPVPKQMQVFPHEQRSVSSVIPPTDQLLLNNSVSSASPKVQRLALRSPVKFYPTRRSVGRILLPPEAFEAEMRVKFEKLTAAAKGFLCRCLLRSDKVQELVKTIKDTREFAFSFQSETPIRRGNFSDQDRTLLERIVAQLQAALLDIHEIFFDTPLSEQMALIEQTRRNSREKQMKSSTDSTMRSSGPRISTATLKAQERRRKALEGDNSARPRTAPPSISSPRSHAMELSGPLKRHFQQLLSKPNRAGSTQTTHQHFHLSAPRSDIARLEKNRPQTAPERSDHSRPKRPASSFVTANSHHSSDNVQSKTNHRPKKQQQQFPAQPAQSGSNRIKVSKSAMPVKSWR